MTQDEMRVLLQALQAGSLSVDAALQHLGDAGQSGTGQQDHGYVDLGDVKHDTDRRRRCGFSEVVYCASKTAEQIASVMRSLLEQEGRAFGTRCAQDVAAEVMNEVGGGIYDSRSRTLSFGEPYPQFTTRRTAVLAAGTSDIPVAEEAAVTLARFGAPVDRVYDVGVAGLHRLLAQRAVVEGASVLIVVAGMEGALPSVVGGLFAQPLIAVPTSVGYGSALGGFTALFGMLSSCAAGITVVNIDNGFGAAMAAMGMLKMADG